MKKRFPYSFGFLLVILISLTMCKPKCKIALSGSVVDQEGVGITEALIEVGEQNTLTDEKGRFCIPVKISNEKEPQRFVLNVTKLGFGFASKIYTDTASNLVITLTSATVVEVDPTEDIVVEDEDPDLTPPMSADVGTPASPLDTLAFIIDPNGKLIGFGAPPEIIATYQAAEEFIPPDEGATVEVPADALFDPENADEAGMFFQEEQGKTVTASISTVDIYAPDGMPGDFTVRFEDGSTGYMETFGAVDINFYRNGKPLQLRKGMKAKVTFPIDNVTRRFYGEKLPKTMPLLVYDKKAGVWIRDGKNVGTLNEKRTGYVAEVSHFSVFNMDEEFANPACFKICTPGTFVTLPATMEVSVPGHIKPFFPFGNSCPDDAGCGTGFYAHTVARMEPGSPMSVRIADDLGNVRSTYVFIAGDSSLPDFPPCPYSSCTGVANVAFQFDACWMTSTPTVDGTTQGPLTAVRRGVDLNSDGTISNDAAVDRDGDAMANLRDNEFNYFYFNWVYIEAVAGTAITNSPNVYQINYRTFSSTDSWEDPTNPGWALVDFDLTVLVNNPTYPSVGMETTDWMVDKEVAFLGVDGPTLTEANTVINSGDIVVFRIDASSDGGGSFTPGTYYALNLPGSGNFFNTFTSMVGCYNQ